MQGNYLGGGMAAVVTGKITLWSAAAFSSFCTIS